MFRAESIYKSYGKKQILTDVSLSVTKGTCLGLLGLNGSGKSTLLNILAGCIRADAGRCYFENGKGKIAFLPQENPLIEELTCMDNIRLWYRGKRKDIFHEKNKTLFTALGVDAFINERVKNLSGGMKKRLSLAITMMEEPDLLLLDEPLAALDLLCKNGILTFLKKWLTEGGSIILATHETAALDICTDIYSLHNGIVTPVFTGKQGTRPCREQEYMDILLQKQENSYVYPTDQNRF